MLVAEYIDKHYNGIRAEFARSMDVSPQLINKWIKCGWVIVDGKLCKPNIYQTVVFDGRVYEVKRDVQVEAKKMITGFYGKDGAMSEGWETEEEAREEFDSYYSDEEYKGCEVVFYNGEWVIGY